MNRTAFVARRIHSYIDDKVVAKVVKFCQIYKHVDPAPVKWQHGQLSVDKNWQRLVACDLCC